VILTLSESLGGEKGEPNTWDTLLSINALMKFRTIIIAFILGSLLVPAMVMPGHAAVNVSEQFGNALKEGGITDDTTLPSVEQSLGSIVNVVLGFVGMAVFVLVVYAGALWILAAGNEDKIAQSKRILTGSILGLVIVFSAYVIVNFVLGALNTAITGEQAPVEQTE
jgi:cytochrome bd-type quinol oxidase subunit 2